MKVLFKCCLSSLFQWTMPPARRYAKVFFSIFSNKSLRWSFKHKLVALHWNLKSAVVTPCAAYFDCASLDSLVHWQSSPQAARLPKSKRNSSKAPPPWNVTTVVFDNMSLAVNPPLRYHPHNCIERGDSQRMVMRKCRCIFIKCTETVVRENTSDDKCA